MFNSRAAVGNGSRFSCSSMPKLIDGKRAQLPDIYYSGVGILHELTTEEMEEAFRQHLAQRNKEKTA